MSVVSSQKKRKPRRFPRTIPKNTGNERPQHFFFIDTETYPEKVDINIEKHRLRLYVFKHIAFNDDGNYTIIAEYASSDRNEFYLYIKDITDEIEDIHICSHNLFYDFVIMQCFTQLADIGYDLDSFYVKGQTTAFRYKNEKRKLIFFDTNDLFKASVKKLGEALGFDKLDVDFNDVSFSQLTTYCERDVDILIRMISEWYKFYNKHDFGDFKTTLASSAFSIYRHRFMNVPIKIHCDKEALSLERKSYRGGRTEVFYKGKLSNGNYYKLDINSMYPYVMMINKFPFKLVEHYTKATVDWLRNRLQFYAIVAHCRIRIEQPSIMVNILGRNVFPTGEFDCYLTTPEIKHVLLQGEIIEIYDMATYQQDHIFTDFIKYLYPIKEEASKNNDKVTERIAKLIQNSLYGKFGQLNFEQQYIGQNDGTFSNREYGFDFTTQRHYTIVTIDNQVYIEYYGGESSFSFPAIASHVTAFARMYLWNIIQQLHNGKHYYCDTDSIIVDEIGYKELSHLIDPYRIGYLKIEDISRHVEINSPKDYVFGEKKVIKGIKKNAVLDLDNTYVQDKWIRFGGLSKSGDLDTYSVSQTKKHLKRQIRSGKLLDTGIVIPFHLPADLSLII